MAKGAGSVDPAPFAARSPCRKKAGRAASFAARPARHAGGADGTRTHDLCDANAALSQLSYRPADNPHSTGGHRRRQPQALPRALIGWPVWDNRLRPLLRCSLTSTSSTYRNFRRALIGPIGPHHRGSPGRGAGGMRPPPCGGGACGAQRPAASGPAASARRPGRRGRPGRRDRCAVAQGCGIAQRTRTLRSMPGRRPGHRSRPSPARSAERAARRGAKRRYRRPHQGPRTSVSVTTRSMRRSRASRGTAASTMAAGATPARQAAGWRARKRS